MGQAVVDLPDPLEEQPASASSADDLLSQLAGDEIDRMLTEADVETTEKGKVELDSQSTAADPTVVAHDAIATPSTAAIDTTAAPVAAGSAAPESTAANLGTSLAPSHNTAADTSLSPTVETDTVHAASATADATTEPLAAEHTAAELDALLGKALTPESAADASSTPSPGSDHATAAAITAAELDHAVAADADRVLGPHTAELKADAATIVEHDERQELLATVAAESSEEPDNVGPLPIWLRPLEWLNAPLDGLSDTFRENLGKVALLTIFNSVAAIAYVLFFRRH